MPQHAGKIVNIEILRGIAALLVVVAHAVDTTRMFDADFTLGGHLSDFGAIGADLFFVISGFIIAHTAFVRQRRTPRAFIRQRLVRVVPLYWLMSLPWLAWEAWSAPLDPHRILASMLFWPATTTLNMPYLIVGWTLCFEMLFYAMAAFVLWLPGRRAFLALVMAYLGCWWIGAATAWPIAIFLGNPIILEFLAGVLIALVAGRLSALFGWAALSAGLLCVGSVLIGGYGGLHNAYYTFDGSYALPRAIVWGLPCALVVLGAVLVPQGQSRFVVPGLVALGAASYSLYLVHLLVLAVWEHALRLGVLVLPSPLLFSGGVALSIAAGLVSYRLLERPLLLALRPAPAQLQPLTA